jgi:hypothetical protein
MIMAAFERSQSRGRQESCSQCEEERETGEVASASSRDRNRRQSAPLGDDEDE